MKKIFSLFLSVIFCITSTIYSQTADSSRFGIFGAYADEYPYFRTQMGFTYTDYINWTDNHFQNLGAHWTRSNAQLIWDLIEPNLDGNFNWNITTKPDSVITAIYQSAVSIEWLGCISFNASTHNPLNSPIRWKNYLQSVVDRYNGDGVNDLNTSVKVKYWQIGNETFKYVNSGFSSDDYAQVVAMADTAIHSLDSNAKICLVAPTSGSIVDTFLVNTIIKLGSMNINFEIIDLHHWGPAGQYKMTALPIYRNLLDSNGYANVKIWSCENGTWTYQPTPYPNQTQQQQAASLIKRYVWNFANGIEKLMWNNLMEWYNFFGNPNSVYNSMGLIGDGQLNGEPANELNFNRKSYYSYKLLASTIDRYFATYISNNTFHNEPNSNYGYTYQDIITGDNFDVFWTDNDSAIYNFTVASNYELIEMIPFNTIGTFATQPFIAGTHNITIYKNQVYLLKKTSVSGMPDTENKNNFLTILPNPFSSKTTLQTDSQLKDATLTIYNSFGQQVKQIKNISGQTIILQRDYLPSGMYFLRLTQDSKIIATDKLIINE